MGTAAWPVPAAPAALTAAPHPCSACRRRRRPTCPRSGGAAVARPGKGPGGGKSRLTRAVAVVGISTHGNPIPTWSWAPLGPRVRSREAGAVWYRAASPHPSTAGSGAVRGLVQALWGLFSSICSPALSLILRLRRMVSTSIPCCTCCCYDNECILKTNTSRRHIADKPTPNASKPTCCYRCLLCLPAQPVALSDPLGHGHPLVSTGRHSWCCR